MTVVAPIEQAPDLGPDDFLAALQHLLPRGRAWPRDAGANLTGLLYGIAAAWAAGHAKQRALLADGFPSTAVGLLPEWEETLGLPDPCLGADPAIGVRQAQVVLRFTSAGGQSPQYYIDLAASLGVAITITEYAPTRAMIDKCDGPLRTVGWAFIWLVTFTGVTLYRKKAMVDLCRGPMWTVSAGAVGCELNRLKPGHTNILFASAEGVPMAGSFLADSSLTDTAAFGAA